MKLIEQGFEKALFVVRKGITKHGLFASGVSSGYTSVWARDSMISLLGASLVKDKEIKKVFKKTLETLAFYQSKLGQIPNCVDKFDPKRKHIVTYSTIDSTLWFLLGEKVYSKVYREESLLKKHKNNIALAFTWLQYQDAGEDSLPEQQPTSDWQDAFPHKYGHVLSTQALYYAALRAFGKHSEARKIKQLVNRSSTVNLGFFDRKLGYFLPWIWKDHAGDKEKEEWFDSLGNFLAITFGLANETKAKSVLKYVERAKINRPFPVKAIYPPIRRGDKEWKSYFSKCDARKPFHYLNAGIWPFIGGFYIASLVKTKMFSKAEKELKMLAMANKQGKKIDWEFNEWLHGKTGKPKGGIYQEWSAGSYLFAFNAVKRKKIPIFC